MKKHISTIIKIILILLLVLIVSFVLFLLIAGNIEPMQVLHSEGIWYCEDLQIQVCFGEKTDYYGTHIVLDGQKYQCSVGYDKGNPAFSIWYSDYSHDISADEFLFEGECVFFDEQKMIVEELDTRKEYIFVRISDT